MSNAIISQVEMKVFKADFIATVVAVRERDQEWTAQKRELDKVEKEGKQFPKTGRTKTDCSIIKSTIHPKRRKVSNNDHKRMS